MATSKNRRKNGKTVGHCPTKRMRALASRDLKRLALCNVVSMEELKGERRMTPKSLVYDVVTNQIVTPSKLQEVAMKKERWRWEIHFGVICRNPNGDVYIDKELNVICKQDYFLSELNGYVTDTLMDQFEKANKLHRLTMFWIASPIGLESIPLELALAPVWLFNVLGEMLTVWETDNMANHTVMNYRTDSLSDFILWYMDQERHREELKESRQIKLTFTSTGVKMKKGELITFREILQKVLTDVYHFNPLATVKGFVSSSIAFTCLGNTQSVLLPRLLEIPACLRCEVEVLMGVSERAVVCFEFGKQPVICKGWGNV